VTTSHTIPYANLRPTLIAASCRTDGFYDVRVRIENNGCGDVTNSFIVRLSDTLGHTNNITVSNLAAGQSTELTFTPWPAACDPASVTFIAVADVDSQVCEIDGDDNTLYAGFTNTSPDLIITAAVPSVTCSSMGHLSGTFDVTVMNNGSGPLIPGNDFIIIISDGQGWSLEYAYGIVGGQFPLQPGASVILHLPWTRDFNAKPFVCNFNAITLQLDSSDRVCECAEGNNQATVSYEIHNPDMAITAVTPVCSSDGRRSLNITVGNEGCGPQETDFNLNFTTSTGFTHNTTFTALGGHLPLQPGTAQTLSFNGWDFDCSTGSVDYTVSISSAGSACDLDAGNQSMTATHTPVEPDLQIGDITWNCRDDGSIAFTVSVFNTGNGNADNAIFTVYDGNGAPVYSEMLDLGVGQTANLTFTTAVYPKDTDNLFRFVIDNEHGVCECDGGNNEKSTIVNCPSQTGEPHLVVKKFCPPGQGPGGLFRFELHVENNGETPLTNVRVQDTLPKGFQYVPGSSTLDGAKMSDPQIQDRSNLTWTIGNLPVGAKHTLVFSVVTDADIEPGRYCNNLTAFSNEYNSDSTSCCVVVTKQPGEGCCLYIDGSPYAPFHRPEAPISFIEPYFHTESASYTIWAIFNLWNNIQLENGSMPLFIKERLSNYARSTLDEFYLRSRFGITNPDGTLRLSFAGGYPELFNNGKDEDVESGAETGSTDNQNWLSQRYWIRKQVDETMTVSQVGFELLALNAASSVEKRSDVKQELERLIREKLDFLADYIDKLPHGWELNDEKDKDKDKEKTAKAVKTGTGETGKQGIRKLDEEATLYDRAVLYLSMVELGKSGKEKADDFAKKIKETLKDLDTTHFDFTHLREELFFTLALLHSEGTTTAGTGNSNAIEQAKAKINVFESIVKAGNEQDKNKNKDKNTDKNKNNEKETGGRLQNLHDYALAAAVDRQAGGTIHNELMARMKDKYYMKDTGILADVQPDFTFKLDLSTLGALILAFDTPPAVTAETGSNPPSSPKTAPAIDTVEASSILYRSVDEIGLFLKKRNLSIGKPMFSLLKNYPFSDPVVPVIALVRGNRYVVPVFSRQAIIHSTQLKPMGEVLIPHNFSKVLSTGYEPNTSQIAELSYSLQYVGTILLQHPLPVFKEEGRSLIFTGQRYVDSLLQSGSGIVENGFNLVPHDQIAVKGPIRDKYPMEPLNSSTRFSMDTLVNYLLAEKGYLDTAQYAGIVGQNAEKMRQVLQAQLGLVQELIKNGTVPAYFVFDDQETLSRKVFLDLPKAFDYEKHLIPSKETASKITIAKLIPLFPGKNSQRLLTNAMKNASGELTPTDLVFISSVPELAPLFKNEIQALIDRKDGKIADNCADLLGRLLLEDKPDRIRDSREILKKKWDKEAVFPVSDHVETIEKGIIYNHDPQELLLYLLAMKPGTDTPAFQFERTLNYLSYLMENEWGVSVDNAAASNSNSTSSTPSTSSAKPRFLALPSSDYRVFRENERTELEPGDIVNIRMHLENICPKGFGSSVDIPSLFIKAVFTPPLVYMGSQYVDGLTRLNDFQWNYSPFSKGSVLDFMFQVFVPYDFMYKSIDAFLYASGRQGYADFDPDTASGKECEASVHLRPLGFKPLNEIHGVVFEDRNINGTKDGGENGIPNITVKDTRGRIIRTDSEGRFSILAGDDHEGVQLELKSLPAGYLMITPPTRLVNRNYVGEIFFGLIPCEIVTGFVYIDENGNGKYDEGETRPTGVTVKARDKETCTGPGGEFVFKNLPLLWKDYIKVSDDQVFYKGDVDKLKISL